MLVRLLGAGRPARRVVIGMRIAWAAGSRPRMFGTCRRTLLSARCWRRHRCGTDNRSARAPDCRPALAVPATDDCIGPLAQQPARTGHGVGVMAVQARRRFHTGMPVGKLALGRRRRRCTTVSATSGPSHAPRHGPARPGALVLVVARQADDVVRSCCALPVGGASWKRLRTQELLVALARGRVSRRCGSWQLAHCTWPVAAGAGRLERQLGLVARGPRTPITVPLPAGQRCVASTGRNSPSRCGERAR